MRSRSAYKAEFRSDKANRLKLALHFGTHVVVDPGAASPFDQWLEIAYGRGITTPPVVFEGVGSRAHRTDHRFLPQVDAHIRRRRVVHRGHSRLYGSNI
jgi:hypothetical protein